jgi:hypothetical protein
MQMFFFFFFLRRLPVHPWSSENPLRSYKTNDNEKKQRDKFENFRLFFASLQFVCSSQRKNKKKQNQSIVSLLFFLFHFVILYYSSEPYFIFLSHVRVCVCVVSTCRPTKKDRKKSISLSGGNGGEEQLIAKR